MNLSSACRVLFAFLLMSGTAAWSAESGALLVLNKSDDTVSFIDLRSAKEVATVPTGDAPHEAVISPDGRTAVVSNYGQSAPGNTLTVIDVPGARVLRTISLGHFRRPHGLAWLTGNQIVVTAEDNQALLVVDVDAGHVLTSVRTGQDVSHMVVVAPQHRRAFVANIGSGSVTVIDLKDMRRVADIVTGAGAEGIDISPDQKEVWVTNREADTVSVIDPATLKVIASLEAPGFPIRAKFTPDGRHVLVSNARAGDVAVFDAATKKIVRRIPMALREGEKPADSEGRIFGTQFGESPVPVGILVVEATGSAFVANTNADIVSVIDLSTWQVSGRLRAGREPDGLAWSPHVPSR